MLRPSVFIALLLIAASFVMCGKKEHFRAFAEPYVLMHARPGGEVEISGSVDPSEKQLIKWKESSAEYLTVDGIATVTFDKTQQQFLRVSCPAGLSCTEGKAFVAFNGICRMEEAAVADIQLPGDERYCPAESRPLLVVTDGEKETIKSFRDWAFDSTVQLPGLDEKSEGYFKRYFENLAEDMDPVEREGRVAEWFYLAVSFGEKIRNESFRPYLKDYPEYEKIIAVAKGKTPEDAGLSPEQIAFLKALGNFAKPRFDRVAQERRNDFPFEAKDYGQLARFYNDGIPLPLLREMIFKKIVDEVPYEAKERVARTRRKTENSPDESEKNADEQAAPAPPPGPGLVKKVLYDLEFGAVITFKTAGGQTREEIYPDVKAVGHDNGLKFFLSAEDGTQLELTPLKKSPFLAAGNAKILDDFKKMSHDDIMAIKNYRRRLIAFTIKYGKGEFNSKTRKFHYELDGSDQKFYWKILALFKSAPSIDVTSTSVYSGPVRGRDQFRWFQKYEKESKKASLHLKGLALSCGGCAGCSEYPVDALCLDNDTRSFIEIKFPGRSLVEENPDLDLTLSGATDDQQVCEYVFGDSDLPF